MTQQPSGMSLCNMIQCNAFQQNDQRKCICGLCNALQYNAMQCKRKQFSTTTSGDADAKMPIQCKHNPISFSTSAQHNRFINFINAYWSKFIPAQSYTPQNNMLFSPAKVFLTSKRQLFYTNHFWKSCNFSLKRILAEVQTETFSFFFWKEEEKQRQCIQETKGINITESCPVFLLAQYSCLIKK